MSLDILHHVHTSPSLPSLAVITNLSVSTYNLIPKLIHLCMCYSTHNTVVIIIMIPCIDKLSIMNFFSFLFYARDSMRFSQHNNHVHKRCSVKEETCCTCKGIGVLPKKESFE